MRQVIQIQRFMLYQDSIHPPFFSILPTNYTGEQNKKLRDVQQEREVAIFLQVVYNQFYRSMLLIWLYQSSLIFPTISNYMLHYVASRFWLVTLNLSLLTCPPWPVTLDLSLSTCVSWHVTHELWLTTCHSWRVTPDLSLSSCHPRPVTLHMLLSYYLSWALTPKF